jgi:hypothetical protein
MYSSPTPWRISSQVNRRFQSPDEESASFLVGNELTELSPSASLLKGPSRVRMKSRGFQPRCPIDCLSFLANILRSLDLLREL